MKRILPVIVAIGAAASIPSGAPAFAQAQPGSASPALDPVSPAEVRQIEGKVVEIERPDRRMALLRLDNGAALRVPEASRTPVGGDVKLGAPIVAQYVERGQEKITTFLRIPEIEAP